ncbi:hypothetical protein AXG93_4905s1090 [Marchantia polymorpha subsp. ruderalis]|uniref:Uncharacterized protein n=1 Tax=Marchantia polymorpha subsp. ruderalis TaxID=1480154 RepID=A0A176VHJ7_MARPO|nr:hypothetical protein AXG93_4905s1090 [Marchantia polymorpha subsp. ruderalis]
MWIAFVGMYRQSLFSQSFLTKRLISEGTVTRRLIPDRHAKPTCTAEYESEGTNHVWMMLAVRDSKKVNNGDNARGEARNLVGFDLTIAIYDVDQEQMRGGYPDPCEFVSVLLPAHL